MLNKLFKNTFLLVVMVIIMFFVTSFALFSAELVAINFICMILSSAVTCYLIHILFNCLEEERGLVRLGYCVYPSKRQTVSVKNDIEYGGAHKYRFKLCGGFKNGETIYNDEYLDIQFVKTEPDGTITSGVQDEQLIYAMIDRTNKLNRRFPSDQYAKKLRGLNLYLEACQERIEDRQRRGVMGKMQK